MGFLQNVVTQGVGVTYTISFWLKMPGGVAAPFNNNVAVKVGTEQSETACTVALGETGATKLADWTEETYTFTPEADGDYCVGINITTQLYQSSYVAFDDFSVTGTEPDNGGTEPGGGDTPNPPAGDTQSLFSENFDDDSHFAEGSTVPTGWVSQGTYPFSRHEGSYFGLGSHSGDYVFGTASASASFNRDEAFYTPMVNLKGGTEYTLTYWYKAPGGASSMYYTNITTKVGTEQSATGMSTTLGDTQKALVSEWTEATYKFTPEADDDYCFGISIDTQLWNAGAVVFDDFELTAPSEGGDTIPDVDPDKVVCELPYSQSFDNENNDYDGTTFVPAGWLSVGSSPFTTANTDALPAVDGTYYLIAPESQIGRDDRIYTPFFKLDKDVTYTATFYVYMPGNTVGGVTSASDFSFTVGKEQDSEFHTALLTIPEYTNTEWKKMTVNYTPTTSDYYCFSFALGGANTYAGEVAIDLFTLTAPSLISKPKAAFSYNGHFNLMDSQLALFPGSTVTMVNQSKYGVSYLWEAPGATPETSTDVNPTFTFPETGSYTVKLTATNVKGESSASETIPVTIFEEANQLPLGCYNPNEDNLMTRDQLPSYDTAVGADFVTGVNHFYSHFAERYNVPEGRDYSLTSASFYLCYYNLGNRYYSQQAAKPLSVVVYGETDGRLDTAKVYGRYDTTMKDAFGTLGLSKAEMRSIQFAEPIVAKGPFYVAFEFAKDLWITEPDPNLSRTVVGFGGFYHRSNETTFYVQPDSLPATSTYTLDGGYCPVDSVDASFKGLGLNLVMWMNVTDPATAIAVAPNGQVVFATRMDGDNLTVSGTQPGETVTVYNVSGQIVARGEAQGQSTTLSLSAQPSGLYVVTTKSGTQKLLKK